MQRCSPPKSAHAFEQHSVSSLQNSPAFEQVGPRLQLPSTVSQSLLQHSELLAHSSPAEAHTLSVLHSPATQLKEQQSAAVSQLFPAAVQPPLPARQVRAPVPSSAHLPEQQVAPLRHASPAGVQAPSACEHKF